MLWTAPLHCRLHGHLPGCVETSRSPGYLRLGRVRVESWMRSLAISEVISEVFCLAQQKCQKKGALRSFRLVVKRETIHGTVASD